MPDEFKSSSRSAQKTIDLSLLRQSPPAEHRIDTGDVLGIFIEGILGRNDDAPPINIPTDPFAQPSVGFPIPVRLDGTISLPIVGPLPVRGMSLSELEATLRQLFTVERKLLQPGNERILVSLQKPRMHRVLVMRQEQGSNPANAGLAVAVPTYPEKRGVGKLVTLPAYRNDVLNALAESGGLPGLDADNTIYIMRRKSSHPELDPAFGSLKWGHTPSQDPVVESLIAREPTVAGSHVTRIPLRLEPDELPCFGEQDILLQDGDVVFIETRETEFFLTGGLMGGGRFALPRDYDMDILEAISVAEQRVANFGGRPNRALGGNSVLNQDVTVGASQVIVYRRLPNGTIAPIQVDLYKALKNPEERVIVQPGDYITLRYTKLEAMFAFFERHILEGAVVGFATSRIFAGE